MQPSTSSGHRFSKRLIFGVTAPLVSAAIAILIATGVAEPYPNLRVAYLLCVAVGVVGLVQFVLAIVEPKPS